LGIFCGKIRGDKPFDKKKVPCLQGDCSLEGDCNGGDNLHRREMSYSCKELQREYLSVILIGALLLLTTGFSACTKEGAPTPPEEEAPTAKLYSLSVSVIPLSAGTVTRTPSGTSYSPGTEVTLTAIPTQDYPLWGIRWEKGGREVTRAETLRVTVNSDESITAIFVPTSLRDFPTRVVPGEVVLFRERTVPGVQAEGTITYPDGTLVELPPATADDQGHVNLVWQVPFDIAPSGGWMFFCCDSYEGIRLTCGGTGVTVDPFGLTRVTCSTIPFEDCASVLIKPGTNTEYTVWAEEGTHIELALYSDLDSSRPGFEESPYAFAGVTLGLPPPPDSPDREEMERLGISDRLNLIPSTTTWTWKVPVDVSSGHWVWVATATQGDLTQTFTRNFPIYEHLEDSESSISLSIVPNLGHLEDVSMTSSIRRGATGHLTVQLGDESDTTVPVLINASIHWPSGRTLELPFAITDTSGRAEWQWIVPLDACTGRGYVTLSDSCRPEGWQYEAKVWFEVE